MVPVGSSATTVPLTDPGRPPRAMGGSVTGDSSTTSISVASTNDADPSYQSSWKPAPDSRSL